MSRQVGLVRAVAGILKHQDKILVAERPVGKPYSGYWEFPGGKIEAGETGQQALRRELHEELGVEVLAAENVVTHQHVYPDKTVNLEVWVVTEFSGTPKGLENQTLRWVTIGEMEELKLLEGNWEILRQLKLVLS